MRTNVVIDNTLMQESLKATGLKTKKEAVELGLKTLITLRKQAGYKRAERQAPLGRQPR